MITSSTINAKSLVGSLGEISLLEAALACRAAGFDPVECAPILYNGYPGTDANALGLVLVQAWMGITTSTILTSALAACKNGDVSAFTGAQIQASVQANISLNWLDNMVLSSGNASIALYQGDLTHMKQAESVSYLVISALPNDYNPASGSMLAALAAIGVNVGQLAQNKAADYRSNYYSWVSQPISGQSFNRIICFEPPNGSQAPSCIPGIFSTIQEFSGANAKFVSIGASLVSTGSAGANPNDILTGLFNGAKALIEDNFSLTSCNIVIYNQNWVSGLKALFDNLKGQ